MKIRMTQTTPGSVDGIRVQSYEAGQEYDLSATAGERELAAAFVNADLAEIAGKITAAKPQAPEAPAFESVEPVADDAEPARAKPGRKPRNN